ncbi:zinc finger protein 813-like [Macrosteles quadrilineatus]|uniref:zinc finger protein 813-like n=1 Tax=Macrosteles quadrilineatus TaxID=74068 RepID=UPI0023E133E1|nr:zinc finger protein 813-like [Macrosteles quadrilineatus]
MGWKERGGEKRAVAGGSTRAGHVTKWPNMPPTIWSFRFMTVFPMFPIIPQHLAGRLSLPRPQDARGAKTLVVAAQGVPAYTASPPIPLEDVVTGKLDRNKIELVVNKNGELTMEDTTCWSWLRHVRVSPDCHSYNTLVHRVQNVSTSVASRTDSFPSATNYVTLQTVRELQLGEELCIWFDEEVLAAAGIPFLTPMNIQGEKNYTCHRCRKYFEFPNPLKIHLALECGTMRRVELWKRLSKTQEGLSTSEFKLCELKLKSVFNFNDHPKAFNSPNSPENSNLSTSSDPAFFTLKSEEIERPHSEPVSERHSAFKPYLTLKIPKSDSTEYTTSSLAHLPSNLIFSHSPYATQSLSKMEMHSFSSIALNDKNSTTMIDKQAVEMETLVSNLGRSKQGHLCIYCGKVYSRKYGLKIHIRTHTGFKPLKCKYCLRPFGDPSNLNKHVRLHAEGDTPYKCEECGKVLVRRRDLERHIKSRHQPDDSA